MILRASRYRAFSRRWAFCPLVRAAITASDFRTGHLAVADPAAAREAVLRREAEQVRQSAEQARRQERDRRTGATGVEGASRDGWSPNPR